MKNILTLLILLSCTFATMATPDPKKKNQKKARVTNKTTAMPSPPKNRR